MSVIIGKVGLSTNLDSAPIENGFKYTEDTGELYLDYGSGEDAKRVCISTQIMRINSDTKYSDIYNTLYNYTKGTIMIVVDTTIDIDGDNTKETKIGGTGAFSIDYSDYTSINICIQCGDWVFKEEALAITVSEDDLVPDTSDDKWNHTLASSTTKFRISDFASQIATATAFSTKYATMLDIIGNHK